MATTKDFVESLDYDELLRLKQDLDKGAVQFSSLVREKIAQRQKDHGTYCATCFGVINPAQLKTYTLIFGPVDFRKKASFCAIDCLEYFINRLKLLK